MIPDKDNSANHEDFETIHRADVVQPMDQNTSSGAAEPNFTTYGGFSAANATTFTKPTAPGDELKESQEQAKYLSAKATNFIESHGGTHLLLFVISILLLVKSTNDIAKNDRDSRPKGLGFAVFVALLSLLVVSAHYYSTRRVTTLDPKVRLVLLVLLFALWTLAVAVLTFGTTYSTTGNGFFSCWVGFYLAFKLVQTELQSQTAFLVDRFKTFGWQLGTLLIASIVLFFSSLSPCKTNNCEPSTLYALIEGIISTVFVFFVFNFIHRLSHNIRVVLFGINMALWIAAVFVCTFIGPFLETGNGYFSCWFGAVASILLFHKVSRSTFGQEVHKSNPTTGRNVDMV